MYPGWGRARAVRPRTRRASRNQPRGARSGRRPHSAGPGAAVDAHVALRPDQGPAPDLGREAGNDVRFAGPGVPVGVEHGEVAAPAGAGRIEAEALAEGSPGGRRPPPRPSAAPAWRKSATRAR